MSHNQNNQNSPVTEAGLKIPVIDLSLAESGKYLSEPETITDSLLELLSESNDLSSLVIVKLDKERGKQLQFEDPKLAEEIYLNQLDKVNFGDNIKRGVIFSSGKSVYFGNKELIDNIRHQFFKTQPDHCCRYGSLLVSSCLQGAILLDSSQDNSPIRLKIVDSQSSDPKEKEIAADFFTGDCHGKISPQLAQEVGAKSKRPFQFRMAWMTGWNQDRTKNSTPKTSFLAKGTFLPNRTLTEDRGYDIVLDRSSIKGIAKDKLNELVPCGDYQLPKMALGNRANASLQKYDNSWQFSIWFSKRALASDLVPATLAEAQRLAQIQSNPLKLNRYIVEQHDKKASFIQTDDDAVSVEGSEDEREAKESRLVSLLRQDTKGLLTGYPKLVEFQRSQLRKIWLNLAIKGALHHDSAMAQPCDSLKPGTIVAPHLENGTEVIVTRYPIVSKDNIRRYTVDNNQPAAQSLLNYRGCVFIRSDQAMQHHQCDFDGDQLIVTPTSRFPQISQEIRPANEPAEYPSVVKREKTAYSKPKYTNLKQIAAAIKQNSIGYVATLIGRVQSSSNPYQKHSRREKFESAKVKLLGKLFDALQIEVDSPKSAARYQDHHKDIIARTKNWVEKFPSPLFDYKKDERVYKTSCLPTSTDNNIDCIAEKAVNPQWSRTRIKSLELDRGKYNNPSDYRHGQPMVQLKGKDLAMFEPQSPRLPVGSTFTASIEQSKGALILHVKPESVRLPESELPKQSFGRQRAGGRGQKEDVLKSPTKLQNKKVKRKFYLDTPSRLPMDKEVNGNSSAKKKRNFSLDIEIPDSTAQTDREPKQNQTKTQPAIKQLLSQDASIVLHQSIKSQHQKTGENQLKIDSKGEWNATIQGHDCKVCDRHKKVVFQSNLATDKIDKPLSEANAERFFKMCEQETKKESLNSKKTNRLKRKSKQEQLSI